ncbi:leucine-rich repeat protein [Ruminococcus sp. SR1/5]|uniref:leucine-rich repeat protein n=1 Tax=Ruminococcus sp. SR1/5 TaxID=657323 RepID=UPI0001CD6195|nr:leucine-rich repeat protein [Ruminococcus sp. SR1/5]CBL19702.1 Listeria/Bacterioides repeat [Ruminococcus sp. SR1/5]
MKRKMTSALSLFLTAAMLGTSVPSAVLAEDFSQQPDVQWDSEAVDETADPEGQDQTEEVTGGISVSDNNSENSSEDMGTGAGDDFTSDVTEEPEDKTEESGESSEEQDQDQNGAADGAEEISEETEELASPETEELDQLEEEKLSDDQLDGAEELVSAGESSATGIVASGNCGPLKNLHESMKEDGSNITDTAKWTLDSQGTLTISGNGDTVDCYEFKEKMIQPWSAYDDQIRKVVIEKGITSVGCYSFMKCKNLESVQLPNSLKVIGSYAFNECESLKEIKIPDSVERIYQCAFADCKKLKSVQLSKNLTELYDGAFEFTGLTKIVIPDGVKSIGYSTFCFCEDLKEVTLPNSLQSIFGSAFLYCTSLTAVTFPDSLEYIGGKAFNNCKKLKTVKFGNRLQEIANEAFEFCESLNNIVLPNSMKTIAERAFFGCSALTSVKFGDNITEIGEDAFVGCSMNELILPKNLEELGEGAFRNLSFCERVVVYKSLQKLGEYAFGELGTDAVHGGSFNGVYYPGTVDKVDFYYEGTKAQWKKLSGDANIFGYYDCSGSDPEVLYYHANHCIRFHYGTTNYQDQSQSHKITFNKNAKNATLKTTSKQVKTNSKYGTLPTPTRGGYYFLGWYTKASGGSKVTASKVFKLTKNQTLYAHWTKADLGKATVTLSKNSFTWNGKAQTPAVTVKFQGATLKKGTHYTVSCIKNKEPGTAVLTVKGKGLFGKTKKTVKFTITKATQTISAGGMICKPSQKGKTVTLNAAVKNSDGTKLHFYSNSKAVQVVNKDKNKLKLAGVGAAVITIKADETKHYKAAVKKVNVIQQGAQSIQLKQQSFLKYDKTKGVYVLSKEIFSQTLQISVKGNAAYSCSVENSAKTSAWLDKNMCLTARGNGVFTLNVATKTSADKIYPAASKKFYISVKGMANSASAKWNYKVESDGKITLLKYIGTATTVKVPDTITLDSRKFNVKAIGNSAFAGTKVKKVSISDKYMKSIGKNAFKNCKSLQEVRLGTGITSIGAGAFYGCSALKTIAFPDGLKVIEAELMKGCSGLSGEIYLPKSLTTIRKNAFEGCTKISEIMIFTFLSSVESNAFKNCNSLKKVYFSGAKLRWNGIKFAAGNEKLTGAQIICNAGGGNTAYEVTDITTEMLLRQYPEYLKNEGYSKILNDLQNDCFSIMSGHTSGTFSDEWWAALKSEMQQGHVALIKAVLEDPKFTEEKVNRSLALELVVDTAEYSIDEDLSGGIQDGLQRAYKVLKKFKSGGDKIFKDGDTMKKAAQELGGTGWMTEEEALKMLQYMNGYKELPLKPGQTKPDTVQRWDHVQSIFDGADIAIDAVDFLMTFLTVQALGQKLVDRVISQLPSDSGLYNGVVQLKQYMNQPMSILMKDFLADQVEKNAIWLFDKKALAPMWENSINLAEVVGVADKICKAVAFMMDCPTLEDYNKAWFSLNNAMVLRLQVDRLRAQLIAAKNAGTENIQLENDYKLMMQMYLSCLKKTGRYVAKTMADPYVLNAKFARFDSSLTYENYILTCKWGLADSGVLK